MTKQKVAILGGGGGAIATAMELSATASQRAKYDITVYTPGWRLGGKAASGRNRSLGDRIEEHGLHVLFGFYDNTFEMLRTAYREADRPASDPMATFDQALTPCDELVVYDLWKGTSTGFSFTAPTNGAEPGESAVPTFAGVVDEIGQIIVDVARMLLHHGQSLGYHENAPGGPAATASAATKSWWDRIVDWVRGLLGRFGQAAEDEFFKLLTDLEHQLEHDIGESLQHELDPWIRRLRTAANVIYEAWVRHHLDDADVRFWYTTLDLASTIFVGIVEDNLLGDGFQAVNDEELRAWLHRHGAKEVTLENSPLLRGLYDLTFAYEDGDTSKPNLAAGSAVEAMIRIVTQYKGHILYKMNAGMGDTVFAPMYETLVKRGVRFEFFHWVDKLTVDPHADLVDTIQVYSQTTPSASYPYLIDVAGVPSWPSEPDWDQLEHGTKLRDDGVNLEHTPNPLGKPITTLRRGVDFDHVVLGISIGSLGGMCDELSERDPQFAAMLDHSATVATQAFQTWSGRTTEELGWAYDAESIAGAYREPLDTYCNMSHLIDREAWPKGDVASIGYFCGPLDDRNAHPTPGEHAASTEAVKERAVRFLDQDGGGLWPKATSGSGFDWDVLFDPDDGTGSERFDRQYWRANTQGSERYVRTPAADIRYRLWPDGTAFANLALAGDWTRNGIDGGAFEAAVTSGRLASKAISGYPRHVPGAHGLFEDSREHAGPPPYVEFGGLDTFPGPYQCKDTELWSFMVKADENRLQQLIDRVFNEPAAGDMRFAPLGPYVMMSLGDIHHVIPETPPFNTMGSVDETQVAFWVPTVQVTEHDGELRASRFFMFTSYIWVNNAMSMATGREVYGWPKSMAEITLPDDSSKDFAMKCYGLDFGPNNMPAFMPLLEMTPSGSGSEAAGIRGSTLLDMVKALYTTYETATGNHIEMTWDIGADLLNDVVTTAVPELYLKQIRDIESGLGAAYQAICASRAVTEKLEFEGMTEAYNLTLHHIDSHPVGHDLGIEDQELQVGFKVSMEFLQDVGEILWTADPTGG
ncbi:MAG: acetoacetate decarboxylase family protein [Actinomycetota bacterium]